MLVKLLESLLSVALYDVANFLAFVVNHCSTSVAVGNRNCTNWWCCYNSSNSVAVVFDSDCCTAYIIVGHS